MMFGLDWWCHGIQIFSAVQYQYQDWKYHSYLYCTTTTSWESHNQQQRVVQPEDGFIYNGNNSSICTLYSGYSAIWNFVCKITAPPPLLPWRLPLNPSKYLLWNLYLKSSAATMSRRKMYLREGKVRYPRAIWPMVSDHLCIYGCFWLNWPLTSYILQRDQ